MIRLGWLFESFDPGPDAYRPHHVASGRAYNNRRIRLRLSGLITGILSIVLLISVAILSGSHPLLKAWRIVSSSSLRIWASHKNS